MWPKRYTFICMLYHRIHKMHVCVIQRQTDRNLPILYCQYLAISYNRNIQPTFSRWLWCSLLQICYSQHDDVIKWKHFPRYWPFVRGIHRSPVNSPHKGQWRGALMFSLICARINGWVNKREAGDLRRYHAHYDVIVMNASVSIATTNFLIKYPHGFALQNVLVFVFSILMISLTHFASLALG